MDKVVEQRWFLRKHDDGTIYGPVLFEQLARWASDAQIAPRDSVSTDQLNWIKAPMLADLAMDWLVELGDENLYGPTTLGAVHEFIRLGEIDAKMFVINTRDATRLRVSEVEPLLTAFELIENASAAKSGA